MVLVYTQFLKPIRPATFSPFTKKAFLEAVNFQKLKVYINLVVPSILMFCTEWGAFQFLILMAGYLSKNALAA